MAKEDPLPGLVRCLGPGCDKMFKSFDRRKNRICPSCAKKILREEDVRITPRTLYRGGRRLPPPDDY